MQRLLFFLLAGAFLPLTSTTAFSLPEQQKQVLCFQFKKVKDLLDQLALIQAKLNLELAQKHELKSILQALEKSKQKLINPIHPHLPPPQTATINETAQATALDNKIAKINAAITANQNSLLALNKAFNQYSALKNRAMTRLKKMLLFLTQQHKVSNLELLTALKASCPEVEIVMSALDATATIVTVPSEKLFAELFAQVLQELTTGNAT